MNYLTLRRSAAWLLTFLLILLLIGCRPGNDLPINKPSPQPSETITATAYSFSSTSTSESTLIKTPVPSDTVEPPQMAETANPSPTVTPTMEPLSEKPYLVLYRGENEFTLHRANGQGQKLVQLPNIDKFGVRYKPTSLISPDGKWIAFFQGDTEKPTSLALCLFNIEDGSITPITNLVTDGFTDRLKTLAEKIPTLYPGYYPPGEDILSLVIKDFDYNLLNLAWSPDSRYLAFSAFLDGLSSDLYVYDFKTNGIKRLSSDAENVASIEWSPDSRYILYENSRPDWVYNPTVLLFTKPEMALPDQFDHLIKQPVIEKSWWGKEGWMASHLLMTFNSGGDTASKGHLAITNLDTGVKTIIWEDTYDYLAVDLNYQLIALSTNPSVFGDIDPSSGRPTDGVYLLSMDGKYMKVSDLFLRDLVYRGGNLSRFVGINDDGQIVAITNTGTAKVIGSRPEAHFAVSPDHSLLAVWNWEGIDLYDRNDQLVNTLKINQVSGMVWASDSKSIFYSTHEESIFLWKEERLSR